jgi:beta-glucosidase
VGGNGVMSMFRNQFYFASSPYKAIQAAAPDSKLLFDSGAYPADAAAVAPRAEVAIVFVTRHELEGFDVPNLELPHGQNALIDAVASANPRTIVVLETGNPVAMPWLDKVSAVLAAWYPGQEGGQAIADILFGAVNPSGRLPITFPKDEAATMRAKLPNLGSEAGAEVSVVYSEGGDVGYRWYAKNKVAPLFAFGHGLSYTTFAYANIKVSGGKTLSVSVEVHNTGDRAGADVPQIYLTSAAGESTLRLIGFQRVELQPGERRTVTVAADPRLLSHFNEAQHKWVLTTGIYQASVGRSAVDLVGGGEARVSSK